MALSDVMKTAALAGLGASTGGAGLAALAAGKGIADAAGKKGAFAADGALGKIFNPKYRREERDMLAADLERLKTDPDSLGMTDEQRQEMISEATQEARTAAQGQMSQLSRDALAGQGFQQGAFLEAQQQAANQTADAAARASADARTLHNQLVEQEKARILGNVRRERELAAENAKFWAQFGLDAGAALGILGKGSGSPTAAAPGAAPPGAGGSAPAAETTSLQAASAASAPG